MTTARSRRILALVLAAIAVIALAACGSSKKSSSGGANADPAAIVPASATIYVEADIDPSANQKAAFNSLSQNVLGIPNPGDRIVAAIDKGAKKDGVTFEKDIKPWLGGKAAIAITKLAPSSSASLYAAVIDTTDPDKAMAAITKGQKVNKGTINGVDYVATSDGTYAGTIDDYLIVGPRAGFASFIAGQKGDKLADNATFKEARAKAPADRLGYLYVDFDSLLSYAASTQASLASQVGTFKGLFGNIKAISASLVASPTSVEIDASVVGLNSSGSTGVSAIPLGKAPGKAWAAISIRNVGPTLTKELGALGKIGASSSGQNFDQILAQLKVATGLDVQQDLLSWIGDTGAFVEGDSLADLSGAVVIDSTDPAKSQAAIGKISNLLAQLGRTAGKLDVPGGTGIEIATTANGPKVQLAAVGSRFYIAFGPDGLKDAMNPGTTLDSTANYNAAVASLKGTEPKAYVDLQTVFTFVDAFAGGNAQYEKVKPYLDSFTSVIAGYSNGTAKIVLNVKPSGSSTSTSPTPTTATEPTATAASDASTGN